MTNGRRDSISSHSNNSWEKKKWGWKKGTFSLLYGLPYFGMKNYSINMLKNMHSDIYKIHMYLAVVTCISENRLCKTFPHNLGTNAATYLFVVPY